MSRKKRIEDPIKALVVDDEEKWRKAMVSAMENLGCKVRKAEDAQTAIDLLDSHPDINVLVLDWDLRQGDSSETALGEDVLEAVIRHRPNDLIVVIVTGAFHNPDYTDWRKQLGIEPIKQTIKPIEPTDEMFKIVNEWKPFDLIAKKDLASGSDLESALKKGLPSLLQRLKDTRLIEEVRRKSGITDAETHPQKAFKASPPFQLDWTEPRLIDSNRRPIPLLDVRLHHVLKGFMYKPPRSGGVVQGTLSDSTIAQLYTEGYIDAPDEARKTAMNFRSNLRRYLKKYGIEEPCALIQRLENFGYGMGNAWHPSKPVINYSEASLTFREQVRLADSRNGADNSIADDADDPLEED